MSTLLGLSVLAVLGLLFYVFVVRRISSKKTPTTPTWSGSNSDESTDGGRVKPTDKQEELR